jgi:hypothetical protein
MTAVSLKLHSTSRGGAGGYGHKDREKHPLRDKLIVAVVSAILGAASVGLYFTDVAVNNNTSGTVTITNPGSTSTATETMTVTNTTEINRLNQQISNLQAEINQLNQQVSSLTPVSVYGSINVTGLFNSASTISFSSQGITYSVTIKGGAYQIYLPRGQVYSADVHGQGAFWWPWDHNAQLDLSSYGLQSDHISYMVP